MRITRRTTLAGGCSADSSSGKIGVPVLSRPGRGAMVTTLAVLGLLAGPVTTAAAAGRVVECPGRNQICVNSFYHGVTGTVSVDADVYGSGSTKYRWELIRPNGTAQCYGEMTGVDPPRSWICTGVGVGQYQLRMYTGTNGGKLGYRF